MKEVSFPGRVANATRRSLLVQALLVAGALAILPAQSAFSQSAPSTWPSKSIRLIVPFLAGGPMDVVGRTVAESLRDGLGQTIFVEKRPGATGAIGLEAVARSQPDGHTIGLGSLGSIAIYPSVNRTLPWDPIADFKPLGYLGSSPLALLVRPDFPAQNVEEFLALARAQPGQIKYASAGVGGSQHLAALLLEDLAGVSMMHVPYKGSSAAVADLIGGHVDVMFDGTFSAMPLINAGKIRALAVSGTKRVESIQNVPLLSDSVPGYEMSPWFGLFAPAQTPVEIVNRFAHELETALDRPDVVEQLSQIGLDVEFGSPAQLADQLRQDIDKWDKIVRKANIASDQAPKR